MSWLVRTRILTCGLLISIAPFAKAEAAQEHATFVDTYAGSPKMLGMAATFALPGRISLVAFNGVIFDREPLRSHEQTDTTSAAALQTLEPFGRRTVLAPPGALWMKWKTVENGMSVEAPVIARCRANARCTSPVARFAAIVNEAAQQRGRAQLEIVNEDVNDAIVYADDIAQAKGPHSWSAPLDLKHNGAFTTGRGDCKDYAIAKYAMLREIGVVARDLRLLVVRDTSAQVYHAVVAVRESGKWLILDNRWSHLIEEGDASFFEPLFALSEDGVKRFAGRETVTSSASHQLTHLTASGRAPYPISDAPLLTSTLRNNSPA